MSTEREIDPRVLKLYDQYCHGAIDRREFLRRSAAVTIGGLSALGVATSMLPQYAKAQTISFTDERIRARYVEYASPGGTSGEMRGYLVQPRGNGPFPAVIVIHEIMGMTDWIQSLTDQLAEAGYVAIAPDLLSGMGRTDLGGHGWRWAQSIRSRDRSLRPVYP